MQCKINIDFREKRINAKKRKKNQLKNCISRFGVLEFCSISSKKSVHNHGGNENVNLLLEDLQDLYYDIVMILQS